MKSNQVAVVVPIYRFPLLDEETVSLRHLRHFLGGYDIRVVAPQGLEIADSYLATRPIERFRPAYFADLAGYNRLMLSREFYERFKEYEYILIYQLDCLVFSGDLEHWCSRGWDYLGAPWFRGFRGDTAGGLWRTGNGGLSLRRVGKFLEVLRSRKRHPIGGTEVSLKLEVLQRAFLALKKHAYARGYKSSVGYFVKHSTWNEDGFWCFEARHFAEEFRIPSAQQALAFAFEYAPRHCLELNGGRLPFGCHAWYKTDPEFWRSHLLPGSAESSVPF